MRMGVLCLGAACWLQASVQFAGANGDDFGATRLIYPALFVTRLNATKARGSGVTAVEVWGLISPAAAKPVQLIPISQTLPQDGVLDLVFVAVLGSQTSGPLQPVHKVYDVPAGESAKVKAVLVRSATNTLETGGTFVQAPNVPRTDLSGLIGKKAMLFVLAAGELNLPAKPQNIPVTGEIVGPNAPIELVAMNPNRLMLFVDGSGIVEYERWN